MDPYIYGPLKHTTRSLMLHPRGLVYSHNTKEHNIALNPEYRMYTLAWHRAWASKSVSRVISSGSAPCRHGIFVMLCKHCIFFFQHRESNCDTRKTKENQPFIHQHLYDLLAPWVYMKECLTNKSPNTLIPE